MEEFNFLQNIWASEQSVPSKNIPDYSKLRSSKTKILCEQRNGAIMLSLTAVFLTILSFTFHFQQWYTYLALVFVIIICLLQALLMFFHYRKCASIDDTLTPKQHLLQWEAYQAYLLKQQSWNMPVYYVLLNLAMGMYFIEIFTDRPLGKILIFLTVYIAWMLYAYFYLAKKKKQQAINRIKNIIAELKELEIQFS